MTQRFDQRGFSLVELLMTLIVLGLVGVALFQVLNVSSRSVEDQKATIEAQQNARVAINSIADDFRQVSYGKDATQASIEFADIDSVVFNADIFDNPGAETISYYLAPDADNDTPNPTDLIVMRSVRDTTGAVLVNDPQSYGIAPAGLQMRFYNGDGVELPAPVPQPELIGEIRLQVSGVSPRPMQNGDYYTTTLSTTIYPRNLPLTPARSRPNPPIGHGTSLPDCESVTTSWSRPTANTDGTPLEFDDISHYNFYFGTTLGELTLNARLARTIDHWTVSDLSADVYYIQVTCVSRAGVESYPYSVTVDMSSGVRPEVPDNVTTAVSSDAITVSWDAVTQSLSGGTITTGVQYELYRDDEAGFTPGPSNLLASLGEGVTTYVDDGMSGCQSYWYRVVAIACDNDGEASPEVAGVWPAPVSCVSSLDAELGSVEGELAVSWTPPTDRLDGSPLSADDIHHFAVFYDTIPGGMSRVERVEPSRDWAILTDLLPCRTYYINVGAVDACGVLGDVCAANEAVINTSSPCTPGAPTVPTGLTAVIGERTVQLTWDANTVDCDLAGYRIWYGPYPGAYYGLGAVEGDSPISVDVSEVTSGARCQFTLTGLELCSDYYISVTAVDRCSPFYESDHSMEVAGGTSCISCTIETTCSPWIAGSDGHNLVNFEVYSSGGDEEVIKLTPLWDDASRLLAKVWFDGRTLWSADGTYGHGPTGRVSSGTEIFPESFTVRADGDGIHGQPMLLAFDGDMRRIQTTVKFHSSGAPCDVTGMPATLLLADTFDDRDYNGWTVDTGNWTAAEGMLQQTNSAYGSSKWIYTSTLSHDGDFVFQADTNCDTGAYTMFQFNRYAAGYRYVGYLYAWSNSVVLASMLPDYLDIDLAPFPFENNRWYRMRVERYGTTYKVYVDCELYLETSIYPEPPAGRFGFGTYVSAASFDDVLIVEP